MNRFISYEGLPLNSGGAHSISRKSQKNNFNNTLNFLNRYADKSQPKLIDLTLYESERREYSALKLLPKLIWKFGVPITSNDGYLRTWTWTLSENNIEKGFKILELNKKLPNNVAGPISLNFSWNFHFKDPSTNQILPNQDLIPELDFRIKNSRIYLRLSKKSTISVWFAFPFDKIGKYEMEYLKGLKSNLPFKTSEKHWRIWKKSEKGNWVPRKMNLKNTSRQSY